MTRNQDFYVFPNPYRFSDSRHREKGAITFKNLNTLEGFVIGQEVVLRIHTMTGDLVYNSRDATPPTGARSAVATSLDWDMKNRAGNTVGTGVYIFSLMSGDTKLIRKGKVAVVRETAIGSNSDGRIDGNPGEIGNIRETGAGPRGYLPVLDPDSPRYRPLSPSDWCNERLLLIICCHANKRRTRQAIRDQPRSRGQTPRAQSGGHQRLEPRRGGLGR